MAYGVKYRFPFESVEGVEWTIDILKDGYSGAVNIRPVGGSPQLRKDKNDNICGTSLDLTAECHTDGEFEEFSSSNPFSFQVKVYRGSTLVWQGYVSPELYNAPDIAPPYDVRVTATDGLGELKLHNFEAQGRKTISALLTYLLGFTGLNLGFRQITDLSCSAAGAAGLLSSVYVNIDFLAGETCYDVLQYLLGAIHSTITQDGAYWLIQKETGMSIGSSAVACYVNGVSSQRAIEHFGSMTTHTSSCWPVGHMTREYVAPKRKMIVTADNHYRENILGTWTPNGNASNEGDYWLLPSAGDGLSQTITFQQEVSKHLVMSVKVRNTGNGEDAGSLGVYVKLDGSYYQSSSYLYLSKYTGKRRRPGNDAVWSTVSSTWDVEVQAPSETDTDQDYVTIDLVIPLYDNSARSYVKASSLEIQVFNGDQLYPKRVYDIALYQYEQTKGFKKVVNIDNGARGEAPDVPVIFPCTTDLNDYNGAEEMLYGMPVDSSSAKVATWSTAAFSSLDYLSLIARDYALSIATPRVRVSGVLQTPSSGLAIPVIFVDDHDNVKYIVESFSWDLYNDEVSVQMISEPAASITVDGDETMEGETENPTGHQQADYSGSGGGGGGGGTVTSVGLSMPAGFSVQGSPVTGQGTFTVAYANGYSLPTTAKQGQWDNKQDAISDLQQIRTGAGKGETAYQKPQNGIPSTDLASGVIPDVSQFITRMVNDLVNYYTKSETYTKAEVAALIGAIQTFHYEIAASTSAVTSPSNNVLYLIGPTGSGADKYEEYVYDPTKAVNERWVKIGDTSIDLSGLLPLTGGTLTGDLRLKPANANYGLRIRFGDGDYVYILEDSDDHLIIYADRGIDLNTSSGYDVKVNGVALTPDDYVTKSTAQTITGEKTFTTKPVHIGSSSGIDVDGSSYIDIGDARLKWDAETHSLYVTKRPGSSYAGDINICTDGDVSAGGAAGGAGNVKYVNVANQAAYNNISTKDPATIYTIGSPITKVYLGTIQLYPAV